MPQNDIQALARVSSREIDDALLQLQNAFSDGRLDENEYDDRMVKLLKAKTIGELSSILFDVPATPFAAAISHKLPSKAMVILSGTEQRGHFIMPSHYRITTTMGSCLLDLSETQFESPETNISIIAVMGLVQVLIPQGVGVTIMSTPVLGGIFQKISRKTLPAEAPQIRIFAKAIMGCIEINSIE